LLGTSTITTLEKYIQGKQMLGPHCLTPHVRRTLQHNPMMPASLWVAAPTPLTLGPNH